MELDKLKQEYEELRPLANRLCDNLKNEILRILDSENIVLGFPVQVRIKSWDSINDKLQSGRFNVKETISEIQDIVGVRMVTLFKRDAEKICEALKNTISIVRVYDTMERLESNQFGYSSFHVIGKIPDEWAKVPSFKDTNKLIFEVQVRTISEHTWAEISSVLQYKKEADVPKELLRGIGRISALLELVDAEFERLLTARFDYSKAIQRQSKQIQEEGLNIETLSQILDKLLPKANKDSKDHRGYSQLLEELRVHKISTVAGLTEFIKDNIHHGLQYDADRVRQELNEGKMDARLKKGVFYNYCGLIRMTLFEVFPEKRVTVRRLRK